LKGLTVLLYVLGLSYGAIEDFTTALGCGVGKTTAYNNVQAAGAQARKRHQQTVRRGGKRAVIGADGTYVRLKGAPTGIEVVVDPQNGELLGLEIIVSESEEEIIDVIREVATDVEAEVLVSDAHGAYTGVVDDLGLDQQLCRRHVKENVEDVAEALEQQLTSSEPPPEASDLTPEQLLIDLQLLRTLVWERRNDQQMARRNSKRCTTVTRTFQNRPWGCAIPSGIACGCWLLGCGNGGASSRWINGGLACPVPTTPVNA
jgi:hypothetical protein